MANQIVVSSGAKVRNLEGVLTGTSGVVSSVPYGGANGVATLDSGGKVPVSQLPSSVVTYLGTWNAATNTPTLVNGTGDAGDLYLCNVAGTVNFGAGPITFAIGDWVLYGSGTWQKSNGQNGTVTSVAASITGNSIGITGSPITTAGTLAFAFAGTNLQYVNGAGNLTTFPSLTGYVPYTGATNDLNLGTHNLYANNFFDGFTNVAASGSQIVLTIASTPSYTITGSGGQTIKLPDATTLPNGAIFSFNNNQSSGAITINNNSNTLVVSVPSGGFAEVVLLDNSIAAGSWDRHFKAPSNVSWSTNTLDYAGSITSATWNGNVVAINRGGTGSSTQNFVDLTTNQTIGGIKTFNLSTKNETGIQLKNDIGIVPLVTGYTNLNGLSNGLAITNSSGVSNNLLVPSTTGYSYTFPNASGTLALTSNLSSYVPYGGATSNVDLGIYNLIANNFSARGSGASSGVIALKQNGAVFAATGYAYIGSESAGKLNIYFGDAGLEAIILDNSLLTADRTYNFPNASGTLALTSNIPSNIVTGTGANNRLAYWNGTSTQTSSGSLTWDNTYSALYSPVFYALNTSGAAFNLSSNTDNVGKIQNVTATSWSLAYGTGNLAFPLGTSVLTWNDSGKVGIGNTTPTYTLDVSGTGRFTSTLLVSGAATLASTLDVSTNATFNATTLRLGNDSNSGYNSIAFQGNSADGYNKIFAGSSTSDGVYIAAKTGQGIRFWVNGSTQALFINSSSASIFSGNVGIGGNPIGKFTIKTATNNNFNFDDNGTGVILNAVNDANTVYRYLNINANVLRLQGDVSGNTCIGTNTDFGYKLNLNGQPGCNGYTLWTNWSDSRLKENVIDLEVSNVLDKICAIRPVTYNYNELSGFDEATRSRRISGFIAQELMEVFPDMVGTIKKDDVEYYDTNLSNLTLYLVKAIQEQQAQIEELKAQVQTLLNK